MSSWGASVRRSSESRESWHWCTGTWGVALLLVGREIGSNRWRGPGMPSRGDNPRREHAGSECFADSSALGWKVVTVVNEVKSRWGSSGCEAILLSDPPDCGRQCEERLAWKRDVALEISVDVDRFPATVRFAGMLDADTAENLTALLAELIGEGFVDFELQTSSLCIPDEGGMKALTCLRHQLRKAGGNLTWDGLTLNHPFLARSALCTEVSR